MIEQIILYIKTIIVEYGAWGVFIATILEEVVAPVPSPLVPLSAGFFLIVPQLSFIEAVPAILILIAIPVSIGVTLGSIAVYILGFFGGKPAIEKSSRWTGIAWSDVTAVEQRVTQYGVKDEVVLFILRILPIVPGVAISGFCGVVRYSLRIFVLVTFVGSAVRAFILGFVGWRVGELYTTYATMISKFEKYIFVGVVIAIAVVLGVYFFKKYYKR